MEIVLFFCNKKRTAPQTLLAVVTDKQSATVPNGIVDNPDEIVKNDEIKNSLKEQIDSEGNKPNPTEYVDTRFSKKEDN
jgi:hypothetical protein